MIVVYNIIINIFFFNFDDRIQNDRIQHNCVFLLGMAMYLFIDNDMVMSLY